MKRLNMKNGFRSEPSNYWKITRKVDEALRDYLRWYKSKYPTPLWLKRRTELMNICRDTKITKKHLSGFYSRILEETKIGA